MKGSISGGRCASIRSFARRHVHFATDNRLDPGLLRDLIKLDCPVHVPMVGNCDRWHPVLDRFRYQVRDPNRAIQEGVFSMQMEMNKRVSHVREKLNSARGRPQADDLEK